MLDLGHNHALQFTSWAPDRKLNPQYEGIPDVEKVGAIIHHLRPDDGSPCAGSIIFEGDVQAKLFPTRPRWKVESWEPLTLSPSLLCVSMAHLNGETGFLACECGDHGFIREGKWVPA